MFGVVFCFVLQAWLKDLFNSEYANPNTQSEIG